MIPFSIDLPILALFGVSAGLLAGSLALGIRHGIDWDHIAAITDITSTTATPLTAREAALVSEPGVMLTDESHHSISPESVPGSAPVAAQHERGSESFRSAVYASTERPRSEFVLASASGMAATALINPPASAPIKVYDRYVGSQKRAWMLGTLYALGHGAVVTALGLMAILAAQLLPSWIDPLMERVVGVTLIVLAIYLFYSVYGYFRGSGEFRLRSRWMIVFAGFRNGWYWLVSKITGRPPHAHAQAAEQYGWKTAFGIGAIHGIGAETGTQALIIATAAGAASKGSSVVVLLVFVVGLVISNSVITLMSTTGFVSAGARQTIYVAAGIVAATFSLVIGVFFLVQAGDQLPDLGEYFKWIGGPD